MPPVAARPVQWRRLRDNLAILRSGDAEGVLDAAYSVGDAIGGMSDERHLRRLFRTKAGRSLLVIRPCLTTALCDRSGLGAMRPGSVGRHFLSFVDRHGIDSAALLESQHAMSRDYEVLDPLRQWLSDRLTVMHDLWHVLVGYDATTPGESALMCFSLPQRVNDRALPVFVATSTLTRQIGVHDAVRGLRRGARALYLVEQPFEDLLDEPLRDVRRLLRIESSRSAHPKVYDETMLIPGEA
jgi:ubiquinone biosynthesis protein Coq4